MDRARYIIIGLMILLISGCNRAPSCSHYLRHPPTIEVSPLVELKKPVNVVARREYDLCVMRKHGLQVIRLGQTWRFILPNDDLFDNDTAEINEDYKPMLNVIADFMQTYHKISVEVAGYSNRALEDQMTKFGSVTDLLTERQASAVAAYLTSRRINARLIYAVGRGNRKPIAWDGSPEGRRLNRRVEVSFRYYKDNTAWY